MKELNITVTKYYILVPGNKESKQQALPLNTNKSQTTEQQPSNNSKKRVFFNFIKLNWITEIKNSKSKLKKGV
jgi:hypothetical protein